MACILHDMKRGRPVRPSRIDMFRQTSMRVIWVCGELLADSCADSIPNDC
jgi:hypothetical protein